MGVLDQGVVMITGASSAMGVELARQLAGRSKSLILVAQKKDKLEELAQELRKKNQNLDVVIQPADISKDEDVERLANAVLKTTNVDVLINNAGVGEFGLFENSDWESINHVIRVNVMGLTHLTHKFLPKMVERKRGGIINIGSGATFLLVPGAAVYSASKQYIHGFTQVLQTELAGTGVIVTEVSHGPVSNPAASKMSQQTSEGFNVFEISPKQAAFEMIRAFDAKKDVVVPGFFYRWSMYGVSFVPQFVCRFVGRTFSFFSRRNQPQLEGVKSE